MYKMKSSMTFIKSNEWKEIDLILNKHGDGLYDGLSALNCNFKRELEFGVFDFNEWLTFIQCIILNHKYICYATLTCRRT